MQKQIYFLLSLAILFCSACEDLEPQEDEQPQVTEHQFTDKILYSKNPNGHNELYLLDDGEESPIMSDPSYDYWWAKVSPNKNKLLVYRSAVDPAKDHDNYPNAELILADIDGTNQSIIVEKNAFDWNAQGVARWNKDGTKILMCAEVETVSGLQWRLVTTDNNGNNPKILSDRWAIDCNYSIDNSKIVFMGFKDNNLTFDLTKLELQQGDYDAVTDTITNIVSLTSNSTRDHDPDYSPDNTKIVFSGGTAIYDNVDLKIYDVDTQTESTILDDSSANGGSMCWSADGQYIFFHSIEFLKTPFRIKCIHVETGQQSTLLKIDDNSHGFFHPEAY